MKYSEIYSDSYSKYKKVYFFNIEKNPNFQGLSPIVPQKCMNKQRFFYEFFCLILIFVWNVI